MTEKTPEEILAAIDKALEEAAGHLGTAKPTPRLYVSVAQSAAGGKPKTPEEILTAIDKALEETRRLVEAEAAVSGAEEEVGHT